MAVCRPHLSMKSILLSIFLCMAVSAAAQTPNGVVVTISRTSGGNASQTVPLQANSVMGISSSGVSTLSVSSLVSSATATTSLSAGIAPFPSGVAGEWVAPWGNDATGVRSTGTDPISAQRAAQFPFRSGTGAQAISQAYDEMRFAPGTWGTGTVDAQPNNVRWSLYLHGSGAGHPDPTNSFLVGGTRFVNATGFVASSGTFIYGVMASDIGLDDGVSVITGSGLPGGSIFTDGDRTVAGEVSGGHFWNLSELGIKTSQAAGQGQEGLFCYDSTGLDWSNISETYCGQGFYLKSTFCTAEHVRVRNNWVSGILFKNANDNPGLPCNNCSVTDIISTGTTSCSTVVVDESETNNSQPLYNISIRGIKSANTGVNGRAVTVQMTGTANDLNGITIYDDQSDHEPSGAYGVVAESAAVKRVNVSIFGGDAQYSTYGWNLSGLSGTGIGLAGGTKLYGSRADYCAVGYQRCVDDGCDTIDCVANNCATAFNGISTGLIWMPHSLVVTGTGNGFVLGSAGNAIVETPPILFWGSAFQAVSNTTAAISLLSGNGGPLYIGGTLLPITDLVQPVHIHAYGTYAVTGTPTLTFSVYMNGSVIGSTAQTFTVTGSTSNIFDVDAYVSFRANGPTASNSCDSYVKGIVDGVQKGTGQLFTSGISTISDPTLDLRATWSAASTSNTVSCKEITIESLPFYQRGQ